MALEVLIQFSNSHFVIASEAKQSRATRGALDCFVASLLAMTVRCGFSFSRHVFVRGFQFRLLPLQKEGARDL
jgi:hypothetical protein